MIKYTAKDIDYNTWYSDWAKRLALSVSKIELETRLMIEEAKTKRLANSHLESINKTGSMSSNSQRRAQSRNALAANYDLIIALKSAIEIYNLFPEYTYD